MIDGPAREIPQGCFCCFCSVPIANLSVIVTNSEKELVSPGRLRSQLVGGGGGGSQMGGQIDRKESSWLGLPIPLLNKRR